MVRVQTKSLKKRSTGLRKSARGKKKRDLGGVWSRTTIAPVRRSTKRIRGANLKTSLRSSDVIVLSSGGKTESAKVLTVLENSANPHFVRRNIITKGAIVQTEKGYARITSSPGQHGALNGVLLPDYKPNLKRSSGGVEQKPKKSKATKNMSETA